MALYFAALEKLLAAGYEPIGMDHFALPGDELAARGARRPTRPELHGLHREAVDRHDRLRRLRHRRGRGRLLRQREEAVALLRGARRRDAAGGARLPARRRRPHPPVRHPPADVQLPGDKAEVATRFGIDFDGYFASALETLDEVKADGLRRGRRRSGHRARRRAGSSCATSAWRSTAISRPSARPTARSSRARSESTPPASMESQESPG